MSRPAARKARRPTLRYVRKKTLTRKQIAAGFGGKRAQRALKR